MKIGIGINIFGENKNQNLAIKCLKKIKENNKNIEIYNIGFEEEFVNVSEFKSLPILKESSIDLTGNPKKKKPIANEFFDILSNEDLDYFLFLNSDILLSQKAINLIKKEEYESYIFSRFEINEINDINEDIKPYKIEVSGFDAWAVKKEWWQKNGKLISKCIYSEVAWDNIMSLSLYQNSNCKFCNKEFYIGHISHPIKWSRESLEGKYNMKTWLFMPISPKWDYYMQTVLFQRKPFGYFTTPIENEEFLELKYLK
jgi:hypothetical protein